MMLEVISGRSFGFEREADESTLIGASGFLGSSGTS